MALRIKNLTPHDVVIITDRLWLTFEPEGIVPRVAIEADNMPMLGDVFPIRREHYGQVMDLPDEEDGTILIVSRMVADACHDRHDLVFPTDLVRDEEGKIIGCRSFGFVAN